MKKLIFSALLILMSFSCGAQTVTATIADTKDNPGDDLTVKLDGMKRFKIYSVDDYYIFNLDTVTGKLKFIKLSYDSGNDEIFPLNDQDLSEGNTKFGVFELVPIGQSRNCLLLNNQTGETWHIHYGVKSENCWIKKVTVE